MTGKKLERIEEGRGGGLGGGGGVCLKEHQNTLLVSVVGKCGRNADQHNSK